MKKAIVLGIVWCALSAAAAVAAPASVRQGGRDADVYYQDGVRYALAGRLKEAATAFEQAVRLDPKNGNAFFSLGNVYYEQGRWAEAVAAFQQAIARRKKDGEAFNSLGLALGRLGEYEQAGAAFERAIEIFPDWAEPRFHLSRVYSELDRGVAAQVAYAEALERRPDYATQPPRSFTAGPGDAPRVERAAAVSQPRPNPPARAAAPAASPRPAAEADESLTPYESGLRLSRAGRHEEAAAEFTRAVSLDRNHAAAYSALGETYARLGRWRESVEAFERAARLDPKDARVYEKLGRSYAKLRETSPAPAAGTAEGARASAPTGATADAGAPPERPAPALSSERAPADPDPTAVYRVGPGDVLEVRAGQARGSQQVTSYKVSPTGLLDHPRLGEPLPVAGLTAEEVAARLDAELRRRGAPEAGREVSVGVLEYASHAIIVSGMVREPGTKILRREGVPLYVIVADAQPQAGAGQALVAQKATGRTVAVNLLDTAALKMLVRPGDVVTLRALPKQFYYVGGDVRQPGQREFHFGLTLTQALLAAGGTTRPNAAVVTVTRQAEDGRLTTTRYSLREIEAGRVADPAVQPDDRVEVGK